jgi:hypothetical protein
LSYKSFHGLAGRRGALPAKEDAGMKRSLADKLREYRSPVDMLRPLAAAPTSFPSKPNFLNWRDEQEAYRKTAVLFDNHTT